MGILGLGDHVAAIRPEDINGQASQKRGQSSTSKKGNWGHLLVTVAGLIQGSSAADSCISLNALKKIRIPGCNSCLTDSNAGCAEIGFYLIDAGDGVAKPVVDPRNNPYLEVNHTEMNKRYVCESVSTSMEPITGGFLHGAKIKLDDCYDFEAFDEFMKQRSCYFKLRLKEELYEEFQAEQKFKDAMKKMEKDFDISRQILESMSEAGGQATVVLPSPISTYLGGISTSSLIPMSTPAPALR